jgi:hypothetical protein
MPAKKKRQAPPKARKLTPKAARAVLSACDSLRPTERVSNIGPSEVTAFIRRNTVTVPAKIDGDPPDPWCITVEIERPAPSS